MEELVSIIMPACNSELFIKRAVDSVLNQSYENIELIIVDSSENNITKILLKKINDKRIKYYNIGKATCGGARNYGVMKSFGNIITFLDSDDVYLEGKIEKQVNFLKNNFYDVVYCQAAHYYTDEPNIKYKLKMNYKSGNLTEEILHGTFININTIMMNKNIFESVGCFGEGDPFPEDWELYLKIALSGYEFGFIDEILVENELRRNRTVTNEIQSKIKQNAIYMMENVLKKYGKSIPDSKKFDVLLRLKYKCCIAYIMNGKKKEAIVLFNSIKLSRYFIAFPVILILVILPRNIVSVILGKLFIRRRHARVFEKMQ